MMLGRCWWDRKGLDRCFDRNCSDLAVGMDSIVVADGRKEAVDRCQGMKLVQTWGQLNDNYMHLECIHQHIRSYIKQKGQNKGDLQLFGNNQTTVALDLLPAAIKFDQEEQWQQMDNFELLFEFATQVMFVEQVE